MDIKLRGTFTLLSPLSHIGESISTASYLVQEPILQPDGTVEEVFAYSGNAWRGQLRDLAAEYLVEALGRPVLPLSAFHLLFSGGSIGGEQSTNIEQARRLRRAIPLIALLGGGIGNNILPGNARVRQSYPLCVEALPVLPEALHVQAAQTSYRALTHTKQYTRHDDAKDARHEPRLGIAAPQPEQQAMMLDSGDGAAAKGSKAKREPKEPPATQMRYDIEVLVAGTVLATGIDVLDCTEVELGCLVSALHRFARSPHIGGKAGTGHGLVRLEYEYTSSEMAPGQAEPFVRVEDGWPELSKRAQDAKDAYDAHCLELYQSFLGTEGPGIKQLLGAK